MDPVYLRLSEPSGKLPVGASRFFGNPDLPAGCAYPSYTDDDGDGNPSSPGELRIDFSLRPGTHDEHAVFAPPSHRPWETWDHPFEDRRILLQVDSCGGKDFDLNFMDVGVLDFLISPSALARHDFDDVRAIVLSS